MAAGRQDCSICMDSFKNPKLIPCHHSFCFSCLEDYVSTHVCNGRFDCPICKTSVELPDSGVSGFPTNCYIDTHASDNFSCDICGPKIVAIRRCLECEENLCSSCCNVHEKSKASRHHKIRDLRTLDSETKGKIRQRVFCEQHPEDEIRFFCRECKVLICLLCKVDNHPNHTTANVDAAAAELRTTLDIKLNECSDKLKRINASKKMAEELDKKINDAEQEELKTVDDQRSCINKILDQQVTNAKARIKTVYHDHRQQNAVFTRDMQDEFNMCWNAKDQAQTLIDQGTDIDIINKCPDLQQTISLAISKTDQTPSTSLEKKLFSPGLVKPDELSSMFGMMHQSTKLSPEEKLQKEKEEKEKKEREEREEKEREEREKKVRVEPTT
ncbi:hypothetical protein ACJMK2_002677 [Sinanodonta woodiana]|uniref:Uncharacterized protein n=1 Tax=Sinanodonta woodiana TaxID=1069815 RepID=A0ABD3XZ95_SINWO